MTQQLETMTRDEVMDQLSEILDPEQLVQHHIKALEAQGYIVKRQDIHDSVTLTLHADPIRENSQAMYDLLRGILQQYPARSLPVLMQSAIQGLLSKIHHEIADILGVTPFSKVSVTHEGKPVKDVKIRTDVAQRCEHSGVLPAGYRMWYQGLPMEPHCVDFKL